MKTGRKSKRARRLITTARMVFRFRRAASAVPVGRRADRADRADSNAGGGGGDGVRVVRAAVLAADAGRSNCGEHSSTNCSQKHRSGNGLGGFAIRPVFTGIRKDKKKKLKIEITDLESGFGKLARAITGQDFTAGQPENCPVPSGVYCSGNNASSEAVPASSNQVD
jgi:hypothetical protein